MEKSRMRGERDGLQRQVRWHPHHLRPSVHQHALPIRHHQTRCSLPKLTLNHRVDYQAKVPNG
eukprot:6123556-Pyramimonas_sp.AAC.2